MLSPAKSLTVRERLCGQLTRLFFVRQPTIRKGIIFSLGLSVVSLLCLSYYVSSSNLNTVSRSPPQPTVKCRYDSGNYDSQHAGVINDHTSPARLRIDNKVLVLVETLFTRQGQELVLILEANRIKYKIELAGKSLPYLTHADKGRFGVIIFERLESYLNMDKWNRQLLDKYCREYNVGIISFTHPDDALINAQVKGFPLFVHSKLSVRDYEVNGQSAILRLTRAGEVIHGHLPGEDWTVFVLNHTTYEPLAYAKLRLSDMAQDLSIASRGEDIAYITAVLDRGLYDDIQRVIFGNGFKFWLHKLLFLDALSYLSHGKLSIPLERYLLVDIDDIFVGKKGTRMVAADVQVSGREGASGRLAALIHSCSHAALQSPWTNHPPSLPPLCTQVYGNRMMPGYYPPLSMINPLL